MEVRGSSAIVTGGASGLGEATVRLLVERGVRVVVADLASQHERAEELLAGTDGAFVATEVTDTGQVIATVEAAKDLGPLRALVCCAGIGWASRTIGKDGEYGSAHVLDAFKKVIDVNLIGTFNCIRLAAMAMTHNEPDEDGCRGAIVNTASIAAEDGQIGQAAYSHPKAASSA